SYIGNLFSDLNILAEKFLLYIHINKNYTYEKFLIEELKERDIDEAMEKKIRVFERKVNSEKSKVQDYYMNKIFIHDMKGFLIVDKTLTDSFRHDHTLNILKLFLITLMESSLSLLVEEQRVKIKHDYSFLKHALEYLKNNSSEFEDSPLLMIYYYLWMCFFYEEDEKYFLKAKEVFRKHFSSLSKADKKNIYSGVQVYYLNKISGGDDSCNKEFLNFLLEMLKFNVLSHKKKDFINLNLYRNILILCLMQKEINILKKFISDYINFVGEESRTSIFAYSNAHLSFLQGDFEKALELCNKINFNDLLISTNDNLYFKNDIKSLSLKCLYELNSFESVISHIDAFKHFLKNSKLIKEGSRKKYMNFLNSVNDLVKFKINFEEYKFLQFKKKLVNTKELLHKDWIFEKISELDKKLPKNKN
ncbi:MAG: hypothetical protein ABI462_07700, partial [Ignavibacteria bacterium]